MITGPWCDLASMTYGLADAGWRVVAHTVHTRNGPLSAHIARPSGRAMILGWVIGDEITGWRDDEWAGGLAWEGRYILYSSAVRKLSKALKTRPTFTIICYL
jgi:hypothetical protein